MPTRHSKSSSPKKLKALQDKWYRKLAATGFHDIENDPGTSNSFLHDWHATRFRGQNPLEVVATQTYFEHAEHMLTVYPFENDTHKRIWELHASGLSDYEIARAIKNMTPTYGRRWVNHIVRMLAMQVRVS